MGWVGTVAPMTTVGSTQTNVAAAAAIQSQAKMSEISKFHPYNVLWAQLSDLYGSIGNPSKLSKTIVCGTQSIAIRKVLNILTYFIRCGEIKRIGSTKIIDRDIIDDVVNGTSTIDSKLTAEIKAKPKGLVRTKTFVKNLTVVDDTVDYADQTKKNDIPNVLAFRDSRFVQQELRIGNFQMDTGIDMNPEQKMNIQNYKIKDASPSNPKIKLLITSPENDRYECEAAAEAIDYVLKKIDDDTQLTLGELITANSVDCKNKTSKLLWNIEPVKDGIRIEQWSRLTQKNTTIPKTDIDCNGSTELKRSKSLIANGPLKRFVQQNKTEIVAATKSPLARYASLSDLITANSVGASDRMQWGIEPIKEMICHEEEIHFEVARKRIESDHNSRQSPIGKCLSSSVVFVLGDNEVLSGLKSTSPSPVPPEMEKDVASITNKIEEISFKPVECASMLSETIEGASNATAIAASTSTTLNGITTTSNASGSSSTESIRKKTKKHCTHKKHSGVKFNFEQYPQIVTNYMKNKNLDLTSYDFLEKGLKLEQENELNIGATTTTTTTNMLPMMVPEEIEEEEDEEEQCECCATSFRVLQTPSNATELEFNNEDNTYPVPSIKTKSIDPIPSKSKTANDQKDRQTMTERNESALKEAEKRCIDIIRLPIPKTSLINDKNEKVQRKIGPGFVPSLFIGITDHYIADMVLQVCLLIVLFYFSFSFNLKLIYGISYTFWLTGYHSTAIHMGTNFKATFVTCFTLCSI